MSFFLAGKNPCLAFLKQGDRALLEKILLSENVWKAHQTLWSAQKVAGQIEVLPSAKLESRFPGCRGFVIALKNKPGSSRSFSQAIAPGRGLIVVTDRIQDPQNLGAIIRSAEALGAKSIIVTGKGARLTETVYRISAGAALFLDHYFHGSLRQTLALLRGNGYLIVASDISGDSDWLYSDHKMAESQLALVLGNEHAGVLPGALEVEDLRIAVRMRGETESLNASAAAAILLDRLIKQSSQQM